MSEKLSAVVFGGTGAVGRELVAQLAANPRVSSVTTLGRRPVEPPPPESSPGKLKQLKIDMEQLEYDPTVSQALQGADSVFCALGTTRGAAGSADAFRRVDVDYVSMAARAAKKAGVPHFSLVSAAGASPNLWANDWKLFHGLLYAQSKGKAEEAVKSAGFAYVTIMRPGLLQRGTLARGMEPIAAKIIPSIPVSHVAAAMIADSLAFHDGKKQGETLKVFEMKEMQNYAKEIMKNSNGG